MNREVIDEIELDLCRLCGGTWYDRKELEQRLGAASSTGISQVRADRGRKRDAKKDWEQSGPMYLKCPHCGKQMVRKNFAGMSKVIVDFCILHGMFLDDDEFEQLAEFDSKGGLEASCSREAQQKAVREKEVRRDRAARRQREIVTRTRGFGHWPYSW